MRKTQKNNNNNNNNNNNKNCDGMFFSEVLVKFQIYGSGTLRWALSLVSLRSSFGGFSKVTIIYGILANNW